jgi:hypothetical protein
MCLFHDPVCVNRSVVRPSKDGFGEEGSHSATAVSPNGIASPFATYEPPLVDVR